MSDELITRTHVDGLFEKSVAVFSSCERHRLELRRTWSAEPCPALNFLMLNPSTADERKNDPTVERCQRRAADGGFGAVWITNLFSLRSTDPAGLLCGVPNDPRNDAYIVAAARAASVVVCAWGSHASLGRLVVERAAAVVAKLQAAGVALHALNVNSDGQPGHPLYLPFSFAPKPWVPKPNTTPAESAT